MSMDFLAQSNKENEFRIGIGKYNDDDSRLISKMAFLT